MESPTPQTKQLEDTLLRVFSELVEYKNREIKVFFNVESLYYQILYLKNSQEKWGKLVIKNDRLQRIEAASEQE